MSTSKRVSIVLSSLICAVFALPGGIALGAVPVSANYVGTTSQRYPIEFQVRHGKVVSFSYHTNFTCAPGPVTSRPDQPTSASSSLVIRNGRFTGKVELTANGTTVWDYTTISGRFTGSKATGTFDESWKPGPSGTCTSGSVSFTVAT